MDLKSKIILIAGPTACGKSNFALKLSKKIKGEIVNADSMQVYKNLEILTARPSITEMKSIDHHLYGFVDGNERYNVERWCNDAAAVIKKTSANNLTPILVGPLRKMRPIRAEIVAKAMVKLANENINKSIFESNEIAELVR